MENLPLSIQFIIWLVIVIALCIVISGIGMFIYNFLQKKRNSVVEEEKLD